MRLWSAWLLVLLPIHRPTASSLSPSAATASVSPPLGEIDGELVRLRDRLALISADGPHPSLGLCHRANAVGALLHGIAAGCRGAHAVEVLQVDSRPLHYSPMHLQDSGFDVPVAPMQTLAAVINYVFARRHNYSYTYLHLNMRAPATVDQYYQGKWNTCAHPLFGARAAPWCKLLGVYDRVRRSSADWILFLDTDAIVVDQSISLEQALSADVLHGTAADARRATVVVGSDWPFDANVDKDKIVPGCSGLMAWRPGRLAEHLLTRWWNTNDFNSTYFAKPFEQPGMTEGLLMDTELRASHISVLDWKALDRHPGQWVRHLHSNHKHLRPNAFYNMLTALGLNTSTALWAIAESMIRNHVHTPSLEKLEAEIALPLRHLHVRPAA